MTRARAVRIAGRILSAAGFDPHAGHFAKSMLDVALGLGFAVEHPRPGGWQETALFGTRFIIERPWQNHEAVVARIVAGWWLLGRRRQRSVPEWEEGRRKVGAAMLVLCMLARNERPLGFLAAPVKRPSVARASAAQLTLSVTSRAAS